MISEKCLGILVLSNGGYRIICGFLFVDLGFWGKTNGEFDLYSVYGRLGGGYGPKFRPSS